MTLSQIRQVCNQYDIRPAKSRGQNFLIDQNIVKKIMVVAELGKDDVVLEVGPGLGTLTKELLLSQAKKIIAVELDKKINEFLKAEFFEEKKLELVEGDILKINLKDLELADFKYKIVANLPYNITAQFLRLFLEHSPRPKEIIVMVQKEVAQRIIAKAGEMSVLAVAAQFFGEPKILFKVGHDCFWPEPEVDSAVIKIDLKSDLPPVDVKKFFRIVRIGFSARRKQLHNNLAAGLGLKNSQIKQFFNNFGWREDIRAQDLGVEDWIKLFEILNF